MNVFTVNGIECFSIKSNIVAGGTCTFNQHFNIFSQLIFATGERLDRVIACGTLTSFLESGNADEFLFQGNSDESRLIGVRMDDGRFVGLDHKTFLAARVNLNIMAWCYLVFGFVLLAIVIGILFIWGAIQGFKVAYRLKRASKVSRALESGKGKVVYISRDDDTSVPLNGVAPAYA